MMAAVWGVDPSDRERLTGRATSDCVSLANSRADIVPDALEGRWYLPRNWFDRGGARSADPRRHVPRQPPGTCGNLLGA